MSKVKRLDNVKRVTQKMTVDSFIEYLQTKDSDYYGFIGLALNKDGQFVLFLDNGVSANLFHAIGCVSYVKSNLEKQARKLNGE